MPKIGAWWLKSQEAEPGEEVRWTKLANRTQGSRSVGGKLFLTDRRIVFTPHLIDAALAGKGWAAPLDSIADVGVQEPGTGRGKALGGGARKRLRIALRDGSDELFVANKLDEEVLPRLQEAIGGGAGGGTPGGQSTEGQDTEGRPPAA
jgi:hypothetical protein